MIALAQLCLSEVCSASLRLTGALCAYVGVLVIYALIPRKKEAQ